MREIIARKIATEDPSITAAEFSLLDVKELDLMAPAMTDVAIEEVRTAAIDEAINNVDGTGRLVVLLGI